MDRMPPLTFYDRAVLDLESSALNTIIDAARVIALARGRLRPPGAYRVAFYYHTLELLHRLGREVPPKSRYYSRRPVMA